MRINSFRKITGLVLLLLFNISFMSGCADVTVFNYDYKGESANWTAEYKGFSQVEFYKENGTLQTKGKSDGDLIYTYKGALSELSYVIETDFEFGSFHSKKTGVPFEKTFKEKANVGGVPKESLSLKITMDGKTETVIMKRR